MEALKIVEPEESIDYKTIHQITGKEQKRDHLKPPYFPDATAREIEPSPFKKRLLELFNNRPK